MLPYLKVPDLEKTCFGLVIWFYGLWLMAYGRLFSPPVPYRVPLARKEKEFTREKKSYTLPIWAQNDIEPLQITNSLINKICSLVGSKSTYKSLET